MRYIKIRLESQDRDAAPLEVYAFIDGSNRILQGFPAFGRWSRARDDYCYFEFSGGVADFGPHFDDQLYDFKLESVPIGVGRILTFHARGYPDSKPYEIKSVSEFKLES